MEASFATGGLVAGHTGAVLPDGYPIAITPKEAARLAIASANLRADLAQAAYKGLTSL